MGVAGGSAVSWTQADTGAGPPLPSCFGDPQTSEELAAVQSQGSCAVSWRWNPTSSVQGWPPRMCTRMLGVRVCLRSCGGAGTLNQGGSAHCLKRRRRARLPWRVQRARALSHPSLDMVFSVFLSHLLHRLPSFLSVGGIEMRLSVFVLGSASCLSPCVLPVTRCPGWSAGREWTGRALASRGSIAAGLPQPVVQASDTF